jgi:hypothetical protein
MSTINIREAELEDLNILLEFEQGIITAERPYDPTLQEKINYYDIRKMIIAEHITVLVAKIDSEIVGSGYARIETKPHLNHENYAYLGLCIDPRHRGRALTLSLLKH